MASVSHYTTNSTTVQVTAESLLSKYKESKMEKKLHEHIRQQTEKKNNQHASNANIGHVIFEQGDSLWEHIDKSFLGH